MNFKSVFKDGLIGEGTELIWERRRQGDIHFAIIVNGLIKTADGKLHRTPSGAARHLNGNKPVDGWKVWKIRNSGILLDSLRNKNLIP